MTKQNLEKLRETFDLLKIHDDIPKIRCHGDSEKSIKKVHKETNLLIQKSLNNNRLGECVHITGEMRALTDPFHRYLCEEISLKEQKIFRVIFNLPENKTWDTTSILKWNLEGWANDRPLRKWYEDLRTIYSIANRSVRLYALNTSNEVQYSVFGHKYILLQEKHKDRVKNKNTWLIESETINTNLLMMAEEKVNISKRIDAGNYRKFTRNINGIASKRFLSKLKSKTHIPIDILLDDNIANDFTDSPHEILDTLNVMGFIKFQNDELVQITQSGREFIDDK